MDKNMTATIDKSAPRYTTSIVVGITMTTSLKPHCFLLLHKENELYRNFLVSRCRKNHAGYAGGKLSTGQSG